MQTSREPRGAWSEDAEPVVEMSRRYDTWQTQQARYMKSRACIVDATPKRQGHASQLYIVPLTTSTLLNQHSHWGH
eukprot:5265813-Pyramimonas_sp.AAC.1